MAEISIEFGAQTKKGRTVYFLVTHNSTRKRIPTEVHVTDAEIGRGRIKTWNKAQAVEQMRRQLEDRLYSMSLELAANPDVDAAYIVKRLLQVESAEEIDFFVFLDEWLEHATIKGKKNYILFGRRLEEFLGRRVLAFSQINYDLLQRFDKSLMLQERGRTLYMGAFRHLYREAMRRYNTDEVQPIKNDPFTRFRVPKQQLKKGVRSLTLDELLRIYEYSGIGRAGLARDCFILSFCLMGMNSVDLFKVRILKGGKLCYQREKTKDRRSDGAYIEVEVQPIIKELIKKYKDSSNGRVFDFYHRYSTAQEFNRNINVGLKKVGEVVGIENLQFYQARHTFATLSRNLMRFSKSDVDEALNHVGNMEIADVYIKKDFAIINENNRKLLEKIFGDSTMV